MDVNIKKYADNRDIERLHYIFDDALDVDPTFESYKKEFEYCKNLEGFFEPHRELTPVITDTAKWDEDYWVSLKSDLLKNFSEKRLNHMRQVARVFKADQIQVRARLQSENDRNREKQRELENQKIIEQERIFKESQEKANQYEKENDRKTEKKIRDIEESNKREKEDKERFERRKAELAAQNQEQKEKGQRANREREAKNRQSKKGMGIALGVVILILVVLFIKLK